VLLYEYQAQEMGTNALTMKCLSSSSSSSSSPHEIVFASAGDDQILSVHSMNLFITRQAQQVRWKYNFSFHFVGSKRPLFRFLE
jgi:hypothetical protein